MSFELAPRMKCKICNDDGWIEVWNRAGDEILAMEDCPDLHEPDHAPFNESGLLRV